MSVAATALVAKTAQSEEAPLPLPAKMAAELVCPRDPVVVPRLLLQTDGIVFRHGPDRRQQSDGVTDPGLYLRRARVGADVDTGDWRARIIIEAASRPETADGASSAAAGRSTLDPIAGEWWGSAPRATEAYLAYVPHKAFVVRAGAMRVPLGLSRQIEEGDLRLPERPRFIVRATPDFRVGVAASGDLGLFQYALGSFAAAARPDAGFDSGGALHVVRLSAEPIGPVGLAPQLRREGDPWYGWWRFSTGVSAFYAQLPGADEVGLGGDVQFQWRRLTISSELLWTHRPDIDRVGAHVEPGVFLVPGRIELIARFEWFNNELGPASLFDAWGGTAGLTFFTIGRHVRAQAAYTWRRPIATALVDNRASGWAILRVMFTL